MVSDAGIKARPIHTLRLRNKLEWTTFLTNAGIPAVLQLTAKHLEKMDIEVLGDQLAILQHIVTLAALTTDCMSHIPARSAMFEFKEVLDTAEQTNDSVR